MGIERERSEKGAGKKYDHEVSITQVTVQGELQSLHGALIGKNGLYEKWREVEMTEIQRRRSKRSERGVREE